MNTHITVLALVASMAAATAGASWVILKQCCSAHLDVLCSSDMGVKADQTRWHRFERLRGLICLVMLTLLAVWGWVQLDAQAVRSSLEIALDLAFMPSYVGCVLIAQHFGALDLLHSYGGGLRAERRVKTELCA